MSADVRTHYSCLVISQDGAPVGIMTERDIVSVLDQVLNGGRTAATSCFRLHVAARLSIRDDAAIFEAMVLCRSRNVRHLPVVDRLGRLAGLLTQSDLTRAHMISIEEQRTMLEDPDVGDEDLVSANERLKALAHEDALLQIGNRRAMEVDLQYTHEAACATAPSTRSPSAMSITSRSTTTGAAIRPATPSWARSPTS